MNKVTYIILALVMIAVTACEDIDQAFKVKSTDNLMTTLVATFADGTGGFKPVEAEPYPDNLTINVPWYYPDGSYEETKLDSLILTSTIPNSSYLSPAMGLTDLSSPVEYTVRAQNGDEQTYTISAQRKKSSKAVIESFKLNESSISCIVSGDKVILPFTSADITSQTATVRISYYASISPDPAVARDYSNPVTYTVTAHDGTTKSYTVQMGNAVKVDHGFSSATLLWTKSAGDLGFEDYTQISIAVSGDYFAMPTSNEWVPGSEIKYYNRQTGEYAGNMDVTGVNGIFSIASDTNGVIVGINNIWAGENVCLFRWDNVTAAPVRIAQSSDWSCVESSFYGRKLSVYGSLDGDAVIMSATDGSVDAGGANRVLRWVVKNGSLVSQDPESFIYPEPWGWVAKAVPTGAEATDNYYVTSNIPIFMDYINGTTDSKLYSFSSEYLSSMRDAVPSLTYFEFNNAKYAAIVDASAYSSAMHIFDVTSPELIPTPASGSNYSDFHVFDGESDYINSSASPNWNITAEIAAGPVSDDGFTMTVYFLVTNGGVAAYELSCIDPDAF